MPNKLKLFIVPPASQNNYRQKTYYYDALTWGRLPYSKSLGQEENLQPRTKGLFCICTEEAYPKVDDVIFKGLKIAQFLF